MGVLVYAEVSEGKLKKAGKEALHYASKVAGSLGTDATAVVLGSADGDTLSSIGNYGVGKVVHDGNAAFDNFDSGAYSKAIATAVEQTGSDVVILSFNNNGKAIGPRLSARLKAGLVPGAMELPNVNGGFSVKKSVFSGKGYASFSIDTPTKIISLNPNSFPIEEAQDSASVEQVDLGVSSADFQVTVTSVDKESAGVPLPEADLVVSAGRGLKGPENWGMIEEMAEILGAATACSRAVSDVNWRPHHEHVGQTGLTVRPNLYIAVAISGAIQHLAGVNGSKNIVVINNDPEAPFFKNADYGIVGDAFEVVPKLNEALRKYLAGNN